MISLTKLAKYFEEGLNKTLNNPEIQFKIWADAGEYKKPERDGNVITHYILGNLRTSSSANDANDLVMGVNGLSLDFKIPIMPPRTNAQQTAVKLQKVKDGQYPFLTYITNAINGFFQKAWADTLYDDSGAEFSVAFQAGTALTGNAELTARYGQSVDFNVYVEVYFIQGGINSKKVKVYFDNVLVPYQAVRMNRASMIERDVCAGSLASKNVITSTAFAIDIDYPANLDMLSQEVINYLFSGEPNVAHFVDVQWNKEEKLFFMTCNTMQNSVTGINVVGLSASLMEVSDNVKTFSVPNSFQIGRFSLANTFVKSLTFTPNVDCHAYAAGKVLKLKGGVAVSYDLEPQLIKYDSKNKANYVYLITDKAVSISNASAPFSVFKEVANG